MLAEKRGGGGNRENSPPILNLNSEDTAASFSPALKRVKHSW